VLAEMAGTVPVAGDGLLLNDMAATVDGLKLPPAWQKQIRQLLGDAIHSCAQFSLGQNPTEHVIVRLLMLNQELKWFEQQAAPALGFFLTESARSEALAGQQADRLIELFLYIENGRCTPVKTRGSQT
jgi:hypothetical protein